MFLSNVIKHHQASSSVIKHHQVSSSVIKHHQASSNFIKCHQASSSIIKRYGLCKSNKCWRYTEYIFVFISNLHHYNPKNNFNWKQCLFLVELAGTIFYRHQFLKSGHKVRKTPNIFVIVINYFRKRLEIFSLKIAEKELTLMEALSEDFISLIQ